MLAILRKAVLSGRLGELRAREALEDLARKLSAPLLTADGPLARAPNLGIPLIHLRP